MHYTLKWLTRVIFWKKWLLKIWEKENNTAWDETRLDLEQSEDWRKIIAIEGKNNEGIIQSTQRKLQNVLFAAKKKKKKQDLSPYLFCYLPPQCFQWYFYDSSLNDSNRFQVEIPFLPIVYRNPHGTPVLSLSPLSFLSSIYLENLEFFLRMSCYLITFIKTYILSLH